MAAVHGCWMVTCLLGMFVCWHCSLSCGPVHSNDAADATQAPGFEDGLSPLTAFVVETLRLCCTATGAEVPSHLPGYLDTWGHHRPRWLPGPAGRRNYKEPPHLGRRKTKEGPANPGKCLEVLGPARTSWNITNGIVAAGYPSLADCPPSAQPASPLGPCSKPELPD